MSNLLPSYVLNIAILVTTLIVVWKAGDWYSSRRLRRWAHAQGFQLVSHRGVRFYEGAASWLRTDNQDAYRVTVRDPQGRIKKGTVLFGSNLHPFGSHVEVAWES